MNPNEYPILEGAESQSIDWNRETVIHEKREYDYIYNNLNSVFTSSVFEDLTPPTRDLEDEFTWMIDGFNIIKDDLLENKLDDVLVGNEHIDANIYWDEKHDNMSNENDNEDFRGLRSISSMRDINTDTIGLDNNILYKKYNTISYYPTLENDNIDLNHNDNNNNIDAIGNNFNSFNSNNVSNLRTRRFDDDVEDLNSDKSLSSHTSILRGVWVLPKNNIDLNTKDTVLVNNFRNNNGIPSSQETSYSERRRRAHFSKHKFNNSSNNINNKNLNKSKKVYDYETNKLIASGGAPLGNLDEIGGVEWCPEKQSWKVIGHTGISWCVRRKTWRVWFITPMGSRATRSFNPKEHGTVASALHAAIEFLDFKKAERSNRTKCYKNKSKRNSSNQVKARFNASPQIYNNYVDYSKINVSLYNNLN